MGFLLAVFVALPICITLYCFVLLNDRALTSLPQEALAVSPNRYSPRLVRETASRHESDPPSVHGQLPPKTGRRYIVVGGAGFVGGWIVIHLLQRGEDPKRIRILDIQPPTRGDLATGIAREVQFLKVDISDAAAVQAAFSAPWPSQNPSDPEQEITVFHTAANIRFYERHPSLLANSAKVNIAGTQNVIDAARSVGVTALIYTSSGSVGVRRTRLLLWPWETLPKHFVQVINDDDARLPKRHDEFFSNYAVTKLRAEKCVRDADGSVSGSGKLRTGCIRPGNGVYGPGGDMLCGAYIVRKNNPTWISSVLQNFCYVENCSLAHLCYEQRLIEISKGNGSHDIGGQAFNIADPGPPPTYGDVYMALELLTNGETTFPSLSPSAMLLFSHIIEAYYIFRHFLLGLVPFVGQFLPAVTGDIINLQPSLFSLTMVHLIFDDSRARLPAEKGGLGYKGAWTTLDGLLKTVDEHRHSGGGITQRSKAAGVSFGFGFLRAQKGVENEHRLGTVSPQHAARGSKTGRVH